jgi:hypothetical protein
MDPDWELARQLKFNDNIVLTATYRLRLNNVVSKQAEGRVGRGRPQEKVSWPSILVRAHKLHTSKLSRPRKGDEEDEFNQDEDDRLEVEDGEDSSVYAA